MPSRSDPAPRQELVWDPATSTFDELVATCHRELFATARRMTGERTAAEDALQETYLKAFRKLDDLPTGSNVRAWLYRILVNTIRDNERRAKTRNKVLETVKESHALKESDDPADDTTAYVRQEIEKAIRDLPEKYREVLILRAIQELPYPAVAEAVDKPLLTVRTLVHRGKKLLFEKVRHLVREVGC